MSKRIEKIIERLPKPEKIPLPKLMEAVLPYQSGIYVTVLNIIQCIALAFLIVEFREIVKSSEMSFVCTCRSLLAFTVILAIWHRYASEIQYLWQTTWFDTLKPFLIGIAECIVIFSINDTKVPMIRFIISVAFVQLLTMGMYKYAYWMRSLKVTERLYKEFYKDYPIFVDYILIFLKGYDLWSFQLMIYFSLQTFAFLFFVWVFPVLEMFDIAFSISCVATMLIGEKLRGFHSHLKNDPILGPCFTKGNSNEF